MLLATILPNWERLWELLKLNQKNEVGRASGLYIISRDCLYIQFIIIHRSNSLILSHFYSLLCRLLLFHFRLSSTASAMHFPSLLASGLALAISGASAAPHTSSLAKRCTYSSTDRACWGDYDLSTNYYDEVPDTGNTVEVCIPSNFTFIQLLIHVSVLF
jgi:hypothetical protein